MTYRMYKSNQLTPDDVEIVRALRAQSPSGSADRHGILSTANAVFGNRSHESVEKVFQAYNKFIAARGESGFAELGGGSKGKQQSPSPDAQAQENSPHTLNNTAQPAMQSPDAATGTSAPGMAMQDATNPQYSASKEAQEQKAAEEAGGEAASPRLSRDSTISDEASNISSEDTGNLTEGGDTERKQGKAPVIVRGRNGGVYQLTQNHNLRRISKKELADRQLFDVQHHSEADPDNPTSPDPAARYGYAHHNETQQHGLPSLHPDNVEGGRDAMHPDDRPDEGDDNSQDNGSSSTFNNHHIGQREIPNGHVSGKADLSTNDIINHLRHLSSFHAVGGGLGHRLSWIGRVDGKNAINAIDFNVEEQPDGSVIVQPKITSRTTDKKNMRTQTQARMIATGQTHPANRTDKADKEQDIYAPLHLSKEDMESGNLSALNQMIAHLTDLAHLHRDSDVNNAIQQYANTQGQQNDSHPRSQFAGMNSQETSPMARSWQRKLEIIKLAKGEGEYMSRWKRVLRKSEVIPTESEQTNQFSPEELDANQGRLRGYLNMTPEQRNETNRDTIHFASTLGSRKFYAPLPHPDMNHPINQDFVNNIHQTANSMGVKSSNGEYEPRLNGYNPSEHSQWIHVGSMPPKNVSSLPNATDNRNDRIVNPPTRFSQTGTPTGIQHLRSVKGWQGYKLRKGDLDNGWQIGQQPPSQEEESPEYGTNEYYDQKRANQYANSRAEEDAYNPTITQNRISRAMRGSGLMNIPLIEPPQDGNIMNHPVVQHHLDELDKQGIGYGNVEHLPDRNVAQIQLHTPGNAPHIPTGTNQYQSMFAPKSNITPFRPRPAIPPPQPPLAQKGWKRYSMNKGGVWSTMYDALASTDEGTVNPRIHTGVQGSDADNIKMTIPKVYRRQRGVKTQVGAKGSDYNPKLTYSSFHSINGGPDEQDAGIRDVARNKQTNIRDAVLAALLGGHPDDANWTNMVEQNDWQEKTVPLEHMHGPDGTDWDKEKMLRIKRDLRRGKQLPPLITLDHGDAGLHIIDGKHRYHAMKRAGTYKTRTYVGTPKRGRK